MTESKPMTDPMELVGITDTMRKRIVRDFEHDTNGGCWLWTGAINAYGYGTLFSRGFTIYAHRLAYLESGKTLRDGDHVLHKCDVRSCVNPEHLRAGSHQDNMRDKAKRKRPWHGTRYSRLSVEQQSQIIEMKDLPVKVCARAIQVSPSTVREARRRLLPLPPAPRAEA